MAQLDNDTFTAMIIFAFEHELAKTLADCFLRRTMLGLDRDLGLGKIDAAAEIGMRFLGWTHARAKQEVELYHRFTRMETD